MTGVLRRRETLTSQVVSALKDQIIRGDLKPGDKLPSEQQLIREFHVSRTVVREAISGLKAGGLVSSRQGVGAFVVQSAAAAPFRVDEAGLDVLREIVAVLELRISLEVEAAALAAVRRKPRHLKAMRAALDQMAAAIDAGEDAVTADLDFHRTIAEATDNRHFSHLFGYLGSLLIPRARLQTFRLHATARDEYLRRVNREHEDIYQAIWRRDAEAARASMRQHLSNSQHRLSQEFQQQQRR